MSPVLSQFVVPVTSVSKVEADGVEVSIVQPATRMRRCCFCFTDSRHLRLCSVSSSPVWPIGTV
jgi:hypothetical protein